MNEKKTGPSGVSMMLKALGIDLDPNMIKDVAGAVTGIHEKLKAMDSKLDRIIKHLGVSEDDGNAISDGSNGNGSGDSSSSSIISSGTNSSKN